MQIRTLTSATVATAALVVPTAGLGHETVTDTIARLDTQYQLAVEHNDWQSMDRILHSDFVLVLGNGAVYSREQLLDSARNHAVIFDKQVEVAGTQKVRVFGKDTATVTALLWLKGHRSDNKSAFDYQLWFTDTYVLTATGWRYAFGQASMPQR